MQGREFADRNPGAGMVWSAFQFGQHGVDHLCGGDRRFRSFQATHSGQAEQVLQELQHFGACFFNLPENVFRLLIPLLFMLVLQKIGKPDDGRQRRAQIVGDSIDKSFQLSVRGVCLLFKVLRLADVAHGRVVSFVRHHFAVHGNGDRGAVFSGQIPLGQQYLAGFEQVITQGGSPSFFFRKEAGDISADDFVPLVSGQCQGAGVGRRNVALSVSQKDSIGRQFHQGAVAGLLGCQSGIGRLTFTQLLPKQLNLCPHLGHLLTWGVAGFSVCGHKQLSGDGGVL